MSDKPLSPRHERFVLEFLKDGNATQAYVRAGYSPRGAQPSASRLLRRPDIEAAIASGRERITRALEFSVERIAQEYAKIAFASIDDYVTVDTEGRLRIDLDKANLAQRAGIVELKVSNHGKQEQSVTLKLGKLQALAALTRQMGVLVVKAAPGLAAEDRQRHEERCAGPQGLLDHSNQEQDRLRTALHEARTALTEARATIDDAGLAPLPEETYEPFGEPFEDPLDEPPEDPPEERRAPLAAAMLGMLIQPLPDDALRTTRPGGLQSR